MIVGFIGFGEVSLRIADILSKRGVKTVTVVKGRSSLTEKLAVNSQVQIIDSYEELVKGSNIIISANSPKQALNVAKNYASVTNGIFLDLNNISPNTTKSIVSLFNINQNNKSVDENNNFVDGAIIGRINRELPIILVSGKLADKLLILNNYGLRIIKVSDNPGDVASLKMLRSVYTKGISAVLMETLEVAETLDLKEELYEVLSMTEGEEFRYSAESRVKNSYNAPKRKREEMDEALEFLNSINHLKNYYLTEATKSKFLDLENKV